MSLHPQLPVAFLEAKQQKLAPDHSGGTFIGAHRGFREAGVSGG